MATCLFEELKMFTTMAAGEHSVKSLRNLMTESIILTECMYELSTLNNLLIISKHSINLGLAESCLMHDELVQHFKSSVSNPLATLNESYLTHSSSMLLLLLTTRMAVDRTDRPVFVPP